MASHPRRPAGAMGRGAARAPAAKCGEARAGGGAARPGEPRRDGRGADVLRSAAAVVASARKASRSCSRSSMRRGSAGRCGSSGRSRPLRAEVERAARAARRRVGERCRDPARRLERPPLRARALLQRPPRRRRAPGRPAQPDARSGKRAFRFRVAHNFGYGASPEMAARCLARLDEAGIPGRVRILRALSDTHNVDTQGPVWRVGGQGRLMSDPVSWLMIEPGWKVVGPGGEKVGKVGEVLGDEPSRHLPRAARRRRGDPRRAHRRDPGGRDPPGFVGATRL